ncbi:G protein-activated inward rectifier potassium channel 3 [Orchesella cincta]|uniref:G protein-activated inward rectifier potassium channel 3 n=1 Tax=Orchesella cincta TaxID=48709 RepID=A0A1D2MCI6_ORCCI|nr:G protein-activated inward rectifier potassium channel 3 [Orchesella cincta]
MHHVPRFRSYKGFFTHLSLCDSTAYEREPRLVLKSGVLNAQEVNVEEKGQRYFADIFTTLVSMDIFIWIGLQLICVGDGPCSTFVSSMFSHGLATYFPFLLTSKEAQQFGLGKILICTGFAVIWWTILISHGDMDHFEEENWEPCVVGVKSFSSVFLFSLESQHTIGYAKKEVRRQRKTKALQTSAEMQMVKSKSQKLLKCKVWDNLAICFLPFVNLGHHRMTDICPEAIALLSLQSIAGVLIEALSVGVFIVKLSSKLDAHRIQNTTFFHTTVMPLAAVQSMK